MPPEIYYEDDKQPFEPGDYVINKFSRTPAIVEDTMPLLGLIKVCNLDGRGKPKWRLASVYRYNDIQH